MKKFMKKSFAIIVMVAMLVSFAAFSPVFAEDEPIVFSFTKDFQEQFSGSAYFSDLWIDGSVEQKGYDSETDSLKFSASTTLPTGWYISIAPSDDYEIDSAKYGYAKICYKIKTNVTDRWCYFSLFTGNWPGIILLTQIEDTHKEFNEYVLDLNERFSADANGYVWSSSGKININDGAKFGFGYVSGGSDRSADEAFYVKYVAFFTTKKAAEDFNFESWLSGSSEPEVSEPEASEPETSEPETSEAENSGTESSASEKPNTNTSDVVIISGAVFICAAAAVVVTVSKKRKSK